MNKSLFKITKMDCPSEENLIRLKLDSIPEIINLKFDLSRRELSVYHHNNSKIIEFNLNQLNLGAEKLYSKKSHYKDFKKKKSQYKLFLTLLSINFLFFIIEVSTGYFYNSIGLIADSLDMLADSFVYLISLVAIGSKFKRKVFISKIAGYFQIILALVGLIEVIRRFYFNYHIPNFNLMIIVSFFALIANAICFYILFKSNDNSEIHIRASMIFTSNDIIINLGVITAGLFVQILNSNMPDLIIGLIIFLLVIQGAYRILNLNK
ncbi:MAG: cation transporter [Candidatus Marinimicrobia bacterium]|nr:cation transporter [Candidatus Neomarinimicrobiota bacterium]